MAQEFSLPKANFLSNGNSMLLEKYRIASFNNWKHKNDFLRPLILAKKGFFLSSLKKIVCYFCNAEIDCAVVLTSLGGIHNRGCPMRSSAAGAKSLQNVPFKPGMGSTAKLCEVQLPRFSGDQNGAVGGKPMIVSDGHLTTKGSRDFNGSQSTNTKDASSDELTSEIIKTRRNNPGEAFLKLMRSEANRIKTFFDFPSSSGVPGDILAEAGFFFMGDADNTQCAFCRGVLWNWDPGDDLKSEHKRHFPKCPLMNGQECENEPLPYEQASPSSQRPSSPSASYPVNSMELNARMDSPIVQLVLSMGFDRQDVVTTIEQRLKATGDDFDSGPSLVEAIFSFQDRREEKKGPGNADTTTSKSKSMVHMQQ